MAVRRFTRNVAGEELGLLDDPTIFIRVDDVAELANIVEIQSATDNVRAYIASILNAESLEEYDAFLEGEFDKLSDRIDYYSYDTAIQNTTYYQGAWFSPDSIQSVLGEDVGNEAVNAIDGNTTTFWRDSTNHQHVIIFKLRDYPKKISKIRFFYAVAEPARERLNNMDVHASAGIGNIDEPENILETGINIAWPTPGGVFVEHTLANKKPRARYIKLVIDDTDNGNNQAQIREFEVWVETKDPGE